MIKEKKIIIQKWVITSLDHNLSFIKTIRPEQNGRNFADILKWIFLNSN